MLEMGFLEDVRAIFSKIPQGKHRRQTLLFSATFPPEIVSLAGSLMVTPVKLSPKASVCLSFLLNTYIYIYIHIYTHHSNNSVTFT